MELCPKFFTLRCEVKSNFGRDETDTKP
uniref:Uncharacterized protein n=1 Tax=Arundo donax TaxID=35708 RepID=A0A0A9GRZ3_ARUDO